MKKNLIYHFYAPDEDVYGYVNYNIKLLNKYLNVFDGQKLIKIAVDNIYKDYSQLISFFPNCEVQIVKNNQQSQESEHFIDFIKEIKERNSITFYGHNKSCDSAWDAIYSSVQKWILSLYYFNLNEQFLPEIEKNLLEDKVFSGIMRIETPCPPSVKSDWHYSGTFFWFNTDKLMSLTNWDELEKVRFAVEEYPGKMVTLEKSHVTICHADYNWNSYTPGIYDTFLNANVLGEKTFEEFCELFEEIYGTNLKQYLNKWGQ